MNSGRVFITLLWKDILSEWRAKLFVIASLSFGIMLLLIVGMALDTAPRLPVDWGAGVLWLCIFFASSISMTRHDMKDREFAGLTGLFIAPVDRSVLFYAKWVSTFLFVLISELGLVLGYFIILNQKMPQSLLWFVLTVILGTMGLTAVGTFLSTLAATSSMRDVIVPLLMFPVCIPLFLAVIRLTVYALEKTGAFPLLWMIVLLCYNVAFSILPLLLYEILLEV